MRVAVAGRAGRAARPSRGSTLGGAIGVAYIILSAALVGYTGVLLLGLGVVVGQLVASIVIDALWPAAGEPGPRAGDRDGRRGAAVGRGGGGAVAAESRR